MERMTKRLTLALAAVVIAACCGAYVLSWDWDAARKAERARLEAVTSSTAYQIEAARHLEKAGLR